MSHSTSVRRWGKTCYRAAHCCQAVAGRCSCAPHFLKRFVDRVSLGRRHKANPPTPKRPRKVHDEDAAQLEALLAKGKRKDHCFATVEEALDTCPRLKKSSASWELQVGQAGL